MSIYKDRLKDLMLDKTDALTKEQEIECINAIRRNDKNDALIKQGKSRSCRIAGKIRERYLNRSCSDNEELAAYNRFSYAYAYALDKDGALEKAIKSFDESQNMSFYGYFLAYYLPGLIMKADAECDYNVLTPNSGLEREREYNQIVSKLTQKLYREPTIEEVAEEMCCSVSLILEMLNATAPKATKVVEHGGGVLSDENGIEPLETDEEDSSEKGTDDNENTAEIPAFMAVDEKDGESTTVEDYNPINDVGIDPVDEILQEELSIKEILRPLEYRVFCMVKGYHDKKGEQMTFDKVAEKLKPTYRHITFDWVRAIYEGSLLRIEQYVREQKRKRKDEDIR